MGVLGSLLKGWVLVCIGDERGRGAEAARVPVGACPASRGEGLANDALPAMERTAPLLPGDSSVPRVPERR